MEVGDEESTYLIEVQHGSYYIINIETNLQRLLKYVSGFHKLFILMDN
jgi:hypothetical protein